MAGLVSMLRNGGGLGTGEWDIPIVLFDSLMHRSPCFLETSRFQDTALGYVPYRSELA